MHISIQWHLFNTNCWYCDRELNSQQRSTSRLNDADLTRVFSPWDPSQPSCPQEHQTALQRYAWGHRKQQNHQQKHKNAGNVAMNRLQNRILVHRLRTETKRQSAAGSASAGIKRVWATQMFHCSARLWMTAKHGKDWLWGYKRILASRICTYGIHKRYALEVINLCCICLVEICVLQRVSSQVLSAVVSL